MATPLDAGLLARQYRQMDQARDLGEQQLSLGPLREQAMREALAEKRNADAYRLMSLAREDRAQRATEEYQRGRLSQMANSLAQRPARPERIITTAQGIFKETPQGLVPLVDPNTKKPLMPPMSATIDANSAFEQAKLTQQNSQIDNIIKQADELKALIEGNEGYIFGTVGPKGAAGRLYETAEGVVSEQKQTPALTADSKKELLIANIRKMVAGGGVFSNQDAKRIDNALSMGFFSTKSSALTGLEDVKSFLHGKKSLIKDANSNLNPSSGSHPRAEDFFK